MNWRVFFFLYPAVVTIHLCAKFLFLRVHWNRWRIAFSIFISEAFTLSMNEHCVKMCVHILCWKHHCCIQVLVRSVSAEGGWLVCFLSALHYCDRIIQAWEFKLYSNIFKNNKTFYQQITSSNYVSLQELEFFLLWCARRRRDIDLIWRASQSVCVNCSLASACVLVLINCNSSQIEY